MTSTPLTTTATHNPRTTSLQAIVRELLAAAGTRRRAAAEAKRLSRRATKDYRAARRASLALARVQDIDAEVARLAIAVRATAAPTSP